MGQWRNQEAEDLRWYWNDRREMGLRSAHEVFMGFTGHDFAMHQGASWRNPHRERAVCVGNALQRLSSDRVQVLYAAYGPRNPAARLDVFDELVARLAPYTEFVEQARRAIAEERAESRIAIATWTDDCNQESEREARIGASHLRAAKLEVSPWDALQVLFGVRGGQEMRLKGGTVHSACAIREQAHAMLRDALEAYRAVARIAP